MIEEAGEEEKCHENSRENDEEAPGWLREGR